MTEEIIIDGFAKSTWNLLEEIQKLRNENKDLREDVHRLEQENKNLKKQIESDKGLITVGGKQQYQYLQRIDELEQENKELLKYETYYLDKYIELKDSLEEIKKIAEKYKDMEGCRIPLGAIKMTVDEVLNVKH